eukprot:5415180-Lingulodinium_polyedra.AAC.1
MSAKRSFPPLKTRGEPADFRRKSNLARFWQAPARTAQRGSARGASGTLLSLCHGFAFRGIHESAA